MKMGKILEAIICIFHLSLMNNAEKRLSLCTSHGIKKVVTERNATRYSR